MSELHGVLVGQRETSFIIMVILYSLEYNVILSII